MTARSHPRSRGPVRRRALAAVAVLAVVLVVLAVLGDSFGRARPSGSYRPALVGNTVLDGCFPLPGDARPDLAFVVRSDGDVATDAGPRRRLVLHWSEVGLPEAATALEEAFTAVGFTVTDATSGPADGVLRLSGPAGERVVVELRSFDDEPPLLVRGEAVLDLPVAAPARTDPPCDAVTTTKRFGDRPGEWWE
ncbi:hypothetical protein INN71_11090 [Nocardioides sp. ChNu-153]|uniref:hypothetical protein n=1 Tax=unclassified Nocardioides TaxID=2615069 RepID=UPI0024067A76|nr:MULTISPECIES: hypothetical protein [unclassified Nocardioides]MDF9716724.1 hypothetical protein [Nocardioides sp. ChNu-99]MDN7121936.1 hypothetical protein [Nocardioides sp. ChNu-153]